MASPTGGKWGKKGEGGERGLKWFSFEFWWIWTTAGYCGQLRATVSELVGAESIHVTTYFLILLQLLIKSMAMNQIEETQNPWKLKITRKIAFFCQLKYVSQNHGIPHGNMLTY